MLELVVVSTLNGVLFGMLLFLMASGLTLIFSMMGVLNFAHASFYMLGAFFGFQISQRFGFWPGLIIAPLLVGVVGALVERYGLRNVHRHGHVAELLFTFGLAFVIEEVVQLIWGKAPVDYRVPAALDFSAFTIFSTNYPAYKMFMLLFAIAIFVVLLLVLTRTRVGLIIQAALTHPNMVGMLGHNVPRVFMLVFGVGSALAGVAGVIAGPALVTQANMAALLGPILFVVVVVGGLGSLSGAFVASLLIGLVQTFAVAVNVSVADVLTALNIPVPTTFFTDIWRVTVAQIAPIIPYLLLVLILIFRPTGLLRDARHVSELAQTATLTSARGKLRGALGRYGLWIAAAVLFAVLPHIFKSGLALTTMSLMGIAIIFALSYNMLLGQTGMLSFGHAVYYGLGGFLAVHAMNTFMRNGLPIPLPLIPLVGGFAGLAFGVIFGSVSTRRAGTAFAMISLGLGELVRLQRLILRRFLRRRGRHHRQPHQTFRIFAWSFGPQYQVYYLIAAWCLICMIAMYALTRTPFGRMCNAVRENPERVQFIGYSPQIVRFIAFCLAGFFAGIAGGLAAINFEIVNSAYVGAGQSGIVLLAAYIGGVGFFIGPILGAILVTYLQVMLSDVTEVWQLYFGLLFVGMVMFAPFGIAGLLMMHAPLWRAGTLARVVPAYLLAFAAALILLTGVILLIEMTVHLSVKASDGPMMSFLRIKFSTHSVLPWVVAALLIGVGGWLCRRVWPAAAAAYNEALARARERRQPT